MSETKIVYDGIKSCVNAKSEFVTMCMNHKQTGVEMMLRVMEQRPDLLQNSMQVPGGLAMSVAWDENEREEVFDCFIGEHLKKHAGRLDETELFYLKPALARGNRQTQAESMGFLVYALVVNERCRKLLMETTEPCQEWYYEAYRSSEYYDTPFLFWFLQRDRTAVQRAIGLMLRLREEHQLADRSKCGHPGTKQPQEDQTQYRLLMRILAAGYKPIRNMVKRFRKFTGQDIHALVQNEADIVENLSRVMVGLVMLEDYQVPIEQDYMFYMALTAFSYYNEQMFCTAAMPEITEQVKRQVKQLSRQHPEPGSFYSWHYLEQEAEEPAPQISGSVELPAGEERFCEQEDPAPIERLLCHYRMNMRMFAFLKLEKEELELLVSLFGTMEPEEYGWTLFIAALCKYIAQLDEACRQNDAEEFRYRLAAEQDERKRLSQELRQMAEQRKRVEQEAQGYHKQLEEQERKIAGLKEKVRKLESRLTSMAAELRDFHGDGLRLAEGAGCYRTERERAEECGKEKIAVVLQRLKAEKILVVGGHENWQKKIRQLLPESMFLASDNRNFDAAVLAGRSCLIINTEVLKHSIYYRIMSEKRREQKILYVHSSNPERCLREMAAQLAE